MFQAFIANVNQWSNDSLQQLKISPTLSRCCCVDHLQLCILFFIWARQILLVREQNPFLPSCCYWQICRIVFPILSQCKGCNWQSFNFLSLWQNHNGVIKSEISSGEFWKEDELRKEERKLKFLNLFLNVYRILVKYVPFWILFHSKSVANVLINYHCFNLLWEV